MDPCQKRLAEVTARPPRCVSGAPLASAGLRRGGRGAGRGRGRPTRRSPPERSAYTPHLVAAQLVHAPPAADSLARRAAVFHALWKTLTRDGPANIVCVVHFLHCALDGQIAAPAFLGLEAASAWVRSPANADAAASGARHVAAAVMAQAVESCAAVAGQPKRPAHVRATSALVWNLARMRERQAVSAC